MSERIELERSELPGGRLRLTFPPAAWIGHNDRFTVVQDGGRFYAQFERARLPHEDGTDQEEGRR